jgi:hypothetical protein
MPAAWNKRCCYCHDVIEDELEESLPGAHSGLWILPSAKETGQVSHGICGLCFEARMAVLREEATPLPSAATLVTLRRSS